MFFYQNKNNSSEKYFFDIKKKYIQTLIIMTKAENTRILSPTPR